MDGREEAKSIRIRDLVFCPLDMTARLQFVPAVRMFSSEACCKVRSSASAST